jgi:hypothetical protein
MSKIFVDSIPLYNSTLNEPMRNLGDGLLAVSTTITSASIASGNDVLAFIRLGVGVVGKFLTNFFAE